MKILSLLFVSVSTGILIMAVLFVLSPKEEKPLVSVDADFSNFNLDLAPSQTLVGDLVPTGIINFQSREATTPAQIKLTRKTYQGDTVETTATSSAQIKFKNQANIRIFADSNIYIAQTLPNNLVFSPAKGSFNFQKLGNLPLSLRVKHLLVDQQLGEMEVSIQKNNDNHIVIDIKNGSVKIGFNDLELKSVVKTYSAPEKILFDDEKRKVTVI